MNSGAKTLARLGNVNSVTLTGVCGTVAFQGPILACSLECDDGFAVTLLIRNAPQEIQKLFEMRNRVKVRGKLGRSAVDWFVDVHFAEPLPVSQEQRLAARGGRDACWSKQN